MSHRVLIESRLGSYPLRSRGKVRDIYEIEGDLLIVTTDRISAFDVVLPNGIPDKGKVLNQLSLYWFERTRKLVPNAVISGDVAQYPAGLRPFEDQLALRSVLMKKLKPVPFECVVRGYLYGSGYKEYRASNSVCGIPLPQGLRLADELATPLFTPATKAETGHDVNVSKELMAQRLGWELTRRLEELSLRIYELGRKEAKSKGILIADTKFEFGLDEGGGLHLIDEVLTPDSSRFWPEESYEPGRDQPSYDKQYVREYLETLDWDKSPPGPELPAEVIEGTRNRYLQAYRALTGKTDLAD